MVRHFPPIQMKFIIIIKKLVEKVHFSLFNLEVMFQFDFSEHCQLFCITWVKNFWKLCVQINHFPLTDNDKLKLDSNSFFLSCFLNTNFVN